MFMCGIYLCSVSIYALYLFIHALYLCADATGVSVPVSSASGHQSSFVTHRINIFRTNTTVHSYVSLKLESFRLPFTVNGNGEKRHKISRDTLNGQRLR